MRLDTGKSPSAEGGGSAVGLGGVQVRDQLAYAVEQHDDEDERERTAKNKAVRVADIFAR